jgi:hypothetical protein
MDTVIINKQTVLLETLINELGIIKNQLDKLLLIIPEESLKDYKNPEKLKKAYLNAVKLFPPNLKSDNHS